LIARRTRALLAMLFVAPALVLVPAHATPGPGAAARRLIVKLAGEPFAVVRDSTGTPGPISGLGPGSQLVIDRPDGAFLCTAGFLFSGSAGLVLSAAGHCFLPTNAVATHGPGADYDASRTTVYACIDSCFFGGQTGSFVNRVVPLGPVRYARQSQGGADIGWDFGLVQVPSGMPIRPTLPVWHGPRTSVDGAPLGQPLCISGDGTGAGESFGTMARSGLTVFTNTTTWGAELPSTVGDSGAAVVTCDTTGDGFEGIAALGILTHTVVGTAVIEGTTLAQGRRLAGQAGIGLTLVTG